MPKTSFHYFVRRYYGQVTPPPNAQTGFTLQAGSEREAISEARVHGPMTDPPPEHFVLLRVSKAGDQVLYDSRDERRVKQ